MATLHVLGSGTPTPTVDRFGSSYVVAIGEQLIMFDCGPAATHKLVKAGLWPTDVGHLFFTHHHFDHNVDYPCFLLCRWDQNVAQRDNPLSVYGPPPTVDLTNKLVGEEGAFAADVRARIDFSTSHQVFVNRGGTLPRLWPAIDAHDVAPGWSHETDRWRISCAPAVHAQPYLDSLAWRLDTEEGSFVFTGDTEPCETVRMLAEDADVMVAMCWDHQDQMAADGEDHGQMGTVGAGRLAEEAGVKNLVLVHSGSALARPGSREQGIGDVQEVYRGRVFFGEELLQLEF